MADAPDITAGLTDEQRNHLEQLLVAKTYADGDRLLSEGEPSHGLLLVDEGRVAVFKKDMAGKNQLITELQAPAIVGELELLVGEPCTATVKARGIVAARLLPQHAFEALLDQRDIGGIRLMRNLARALGQKLTAADEVYVDMAIWR